MQVLTIQIQIYYKSGQLYFHNFMLKRSFERMQVLSPTRKRRMQELTQS
jgi:hypothetical protein